jgi:hypothetical protein
VAVTEFKNKKGTALLPLPNELVPPARFWAWGVLYSSFITAANWMVLFSGMDLDYAMRSWLIAFMYISFPVFMLDIFIRLYFLPCRRYCVENGIDPSNDDLDRHQLKGPLKFVAFFGLGQAALVYWATAGREDCIGSRCASAPGIAMVLPVVFILFFTFLTPGYRHSSGVENND